MTADHREITVGIMQPYFMPYIGYWQLMNAVDKYVIYDDVNFIKGGWINRNRILVNGKVQFFNIPMLGASPNKLINEIAVNNDVRIIEKNLRILQAAYKKAPYYADVYPLLEKILRCGEDNLAGYIKYSFGILCGYMDIRTEMLLSSDLPKDNTLHGQDKVLEICRILGASEYYNAIGGRDLYSFQSFEEKGIQLKFLKTGNIRYEQPVGEFQRDLSIIDVMMLNSKTEIKEFLNDYTILTKGD